MKSEKVKWSRMGRPGGRPNRPRRLAALRQAAPGVPRMGPQEQASGHGWIFALSSRGRKRVEPPSRPRWDPGAVLPEYLSHEQFSQENILCCQLVIEY